MTRRIMLIVAAAMLATPAFATVDMNAVDEGGGIVAITYNCTAGEDVRAYALDISLDMGATIEGISDFFSGEGQGYGIFPGSFRDHINPATPNWVDPNYTPVAPSGDPGALGGLGTGGVTIELGSLYVGAPNQPASSGTLCKLACAGNGAPDANMTVALNAARGNVVLEDANEAGTNLPIVRKVAFECYTGPDVQAWRDRGSPDCWCNPRQCVGDAAGDIAGTTKTGEYYVGASDLDLLLLAYDVCEPPFGPGIATITNGICADVAHDIAGTTKTGEYYVGASDLDIILLYWDVCEPPFGPGIPSNCLD
jgi:hypothetical protein